MAKPSLCIDEFLAQAQREASRSHGVRALIVTSFEESPRWHLPGAAWLPCPHGRTPHASLLGSAQHEIWVGSTEAELATAVAEALHAVGRSVRALDSPLPLAALTAGPPEAALWSPDPYLASRAETLSIDPRRPILDLGCGSGRDAVYLAQRGHRVVGVDRLDDALGLARRRASIHRVAVEWIEARVNDASDLSDRPFSTLVAVRFQRPAVLAQIAQRLGPGDRLLLRGLATGGSRDPRRCFSVEELRRTYAIGWEFEDGPRRLEEESEAWVEAALIRRLGAAK